MRLRTEVVEGEVGGMDRPEAKNQKPHGAEMWEYGLWRDDTRLDDVSVGLV